MDSVEAAVKTLAEKGVFGEGKFVSVTCSDVEKNLTHFASVINFIEIHLDSKTIKAVLKRSPQVEETRNTFVSHLQFKIEFLMYSEILPFLKCEDIGPKFYYGEFSVEKKEFLILEDLKAQGYSFAKSKVFLDLNHLSIVMEKIGKFHGLSYKAKKQNETKFRDVLKKLPFLRERSDQDFYYMIKRTMQRGMKPISENEELQKLEEKMKDMKRLYDKLEEVEEPFGVLCHGDFNRNNMIFLYEGGEPKEVRFFDFQTSRYKSPAVDLSFLLYMNTDVEVRKHWDSLFGFYWKGLTSVEPEPGFDFQQFCQHFARKAFFGYMPCSFFLPTMMDTEDIPFPDTSLLTIEQRVDLMLERGGDQGTQALVDIMQHLISRGYIKALNESY